jgi:hypothetical protein
MKEFIVQEIRVVNYKLNAKRHLLDYIIYCFQLREEVQMHQF